jgi:hypothetical protein
MARDRAERLLATGVADLDAAICNTIRRQRDRGELAGVHVAPSGSADVEDDDRVRLVILPPSEPHMRGSDDSPAMQLARELLEYRGSAPRLYRNMIVFLACDQQRLDELRQGMAEALAWREISNESEQLDLGAQQAAQARSKAGEAEATVARRLAGTYTWALVPAQPDPTGPIALDPQRVEGQGDLAARTSQRLIDKGYISLAYAPSLLRSLVLEGPLASLWENGHISVGELWEALARYPYLPRLRDRLILQRSVQDGPAGFAWTEEGFALAEGYDDATGRYLGLVVGPGGSSGTSPSTLLVHPEVAIAQVQADKEAVGRTAMDGATNTTLTSTAAASTLAAAPPTGPVRPHRFHGSVILPSTRVNLEFGKVIEEVVQRLTDSNATDVEITVEISATSTDGFDEAVIRTVTENARTLHFRDQGFEEE